ncbi:hypothetical protein AJ87_47325 [Rhizobium yanglingense]|nr:hypothetical protein AJ87_47325 [Rhizobium yanglingense]
MAERAENGRKNDPQRTQADILVVATKEFATHGLAGARVDAIAEKTRTSKRMIYYYFGSKEGLYLAVLEQSYPRSGRWKPTFSFRTLSRKQRCAR